MNGQLGSLNAPAGGVALQCFLGRVGLFRFIMAPPPGSVIGQLNVLGGAELPLVQTQPTPPGGTSLASVDGQFARVCGVLTPRQGGVVLDVRLVNPGAPSPTGTPGGVL